MTVAPFLRSLGLLLYLYQDCLRYSKLPSSFLTMEDKLLVSEVEVV